MNLSGVVCPTYVGMNRPVGGRIRRMERMPHVCGDEPNPECDFTDLERYAPRMWG